jgi:hypothetical protein
MFRVRDPVEREIRAAPYRDRVVHHAIFAELDPVVERRLIEDTFACRVGKGTHRAIDRAQRWLRGGSWVVKLDIRKYFFSIDHGVLLAQLQRWVDDRRLMGLLRDLLATYDAGPEYATWASDLSDLLRPRGLPIGNLTSQLFANAYLNPLDRFIKQELRVRRYVRYMDDMLLVAPDRQTAAIWLDEVRAFLPGLRLRTHPRKSQILPVRHGVRFLGFHLYRHHRRICRENLQRFKRRMRTRSGQLRRGEIDEAGVRQSLNAWMGFAGGEHARLVNRILRHIEFQDPARWRPHTYRVALPRARR